MAHFTTNIRGAIVGALAFAALAPAVAIAAPQDGSAISMVSYADLNLTTPGGAAKLHSRVARAARSVCQYDESAREMWQIQAQNACMTKALASAQVQVAAAIDGSNAGTAFAMRAEAVRR